MNENTTKTIEKVLELNPTKEEINLVANACCDISNVSVPKEFEKFKENIRKLYGTYGLDVLRKCVKDWGKNEY